MRYFWLFCAILCCFSVKARADIAPDPMSGGISIAMPGKSPTQIVLRHNTVKIKVSPVLCSTRAFFRLHNTGAPTDLEVGFPLAHEGEAKDFRVWIDNAEVAYRDQAISQIVPIKGAMISHWKTWKMRFENDQTLLVEVRYSNPPAEGYSFSLNAGKYPLAQYWRETEDDYGITNLAYTEGIPLHEWATLKSMEYILVTGSYWKGAIERCRVEVDIEDLSADAFVEVRPPARSFSPKRIVWEWNNVDPPYNVSLVFLRASPRQTIIPIFEKIVALHSQGELGEAIKQTLQQMKTDFPNEKADEERQAKFAEQNDSN